jgi:ABC-2 type transport system ATP-binding protein
LIQLRQLNKKFGDFHAVKDLNLEVSAGEIFGFLGPNGAGKTTTMRILSCYMPATSGTARVAGFDVFRQALEVRRCIGYMPENNPLHLDMRVRDYLRFRARQQSIAWFEARR